MYSVEVKSTALKEISRLPSYVSSKTFFVIDSFVSEPRPKGCKKLLGSMNRWRVQIGDYRILYEIDDSNHIVTVFRVIHRKDAYK